MDSNYKIFKKECSENISIQSSNKEFLDASKLWFSKSIESKYSYNFEFLGRPIIQYPQDIIATQEVIFK